MPPSQLGRPRIPDDSRSEASSVTTKERLDNVYFCHINHQERWNNTLAHTGQRYCNAPTAEESPQCSLFCTFGVREHRPSTSKHIKTHSHILNMERSLRRGWSPINHIWLDTMAWHGPRRSAQIPVRISIEHAELPNQSSSKPYLCSCSTQRHIFSKCCRSAAEATGVEKAWKWYCGWSEGKEQLEIERCCQQRSE